MEVSYNALSGSMPDVGVAIEDLQHFEAAHNNLCGSFPAVVSPNIRGLLSGQKVPTFRAKGSGCRKREVELKGGGCHGRNRHNP